MQTCFFAISGVLPKDEAIAAIKREIEKTYGKKGDEIVQMNFAAVNRTLDHLFEVRVPESVTSRVEMPPAVSEQAPDFVQHVTATIIAAVAMSFRYLLCRSTARTHGTAKWRSVISRWKYRCGIRRSAFSAANARWCARTV